MLSLSRKTALYYACKLNNISIVRLILLHGSDINLKAICGCTALHVPVKRGNIKIVDFLL